MDIATLKSEIQNDPAAIGYVSMTNQQAVDALNAVNRQVAVSFLTGVQIGAQFDLTEFNAVTITNDQRTTLRLMWPLDAIPTTPGTFFREYLLSIFAGGSVTRTNLLAAFTRTTSRAAELGLPPVGAHHVAAARTL